MRIRRSGEDLTPPLALLQRTARGQGSMMEFDNPGTERRVPSISGRVLAGLDVWLARMGPLHGGGGAGGFAHGCHECLGDRG